MSVGRALDAELRPGAVTVEADGRRAEVEVLDVDRIGARIGRLRVHVPDAAPLSEQVRRMPDALRSLPEDIVPVEVAPTLGGAVYRSRREQVEGGEFYELRTDGGAGTLRRVRRDSPGDAPFDLTREQLRRLVDGLGDALGTADD